MEELDLREIIDLFWKNKIQIILIILAFVVIGAVYTMYFVTPVFTPSTTLLLATEQSAGKEDLSITTTDVTLNSKLISTYSELIKSKKVLRKVKDNLGIDISENTLKGRISVKAVSDTEFIRISVSDEDSETATRIANETAKVFAEEVSEYYKINNVHVVDVAEVEEEPSNVNHIKDILIFAAIGAVLAAIVTVLENMLDTSIQSVDDIEKLCSIVVLASIPFDSTEGKKGGRR